MLPSPKPLQILADATGGYPFQSRKFCIENSERQEPLIDSGINFTFEKFGETVKSGDSKDLRALSKKATNPLFTFFLDGSRITYKIGDVQYGGRVYPILVGQLGVACCQRHNPALFKSVKVVNRIVVAIPCSANANGKGVNSKDPFYTKLTERINNESSLKRIGIQIDAIIPYPEKSEFEYTNLAIATLHQEMMDMEKGMVNWLVQDKKLLSSDKRLIKDGSVEYQNSSYGSYGEISRLISNYQSVVGVSKRFNPEKCVDRNGKSNASLIAQLPLYHRTPAYKFKSAHSSARENPVWMAAWYVRIRATERTIGPFDGIVKIERILVTEKEKEIGLDSEEVDWISANIISERNPTCYGKDARWANHLYPIYLTELSMKSQRISGQVLINLL